MIVYKLTDKNMQTYCGCQWELGVPKHANGKGRLCGPGWLHCCSDPILAILMNPIHADFINPRLFKAEAGDEFLDDNGLKMGVTTMTLIEELPVPVISDEKRVRFAIFCALAVYCEPTFVKWANGWLDGTDRSNTAQKMAWKIARIVNATGRSAITAQGEAQGAAQAAAEAAAVLTPTGETMPLKYGSYGREVYTWAAWSAQRAALASAGSADLITMAHKAMEVVQDAR
jgi:hypothetical protein